MNNSPESGSKKLLRTCAHSHTNLINPSLCAPRARRSTGHVHRLQVDCFVELHEHCFRPDNDHQHSRFLNTQVPYFIKDWLLELLVVYTSILNGIEELFNRDLF